MAIPGVGESSLANTLLTMARDLAVTGQSLVDAGDMLVERAGGDIDAIDVALNLAEMAVGASRLSLVDRRAFTMLARASMHDELPHGNSR